jgi:WhiB family redox-sensing transcriptional regulator
VSVESPARTNRLQHLAQDVNDYVSEFGLPTDGWQSQGACWGVGPDVFYPHKGESPIEAIAVCEACPVRVECLVTAMWNGERYGVWGGTAERTRRSLRRLISHSFRTIAA